MKVEYYPLTPAAWEACRQLRGEADALAERLIDVLDEQPIVVGGLALVRTLDAYLTTLVSTLEQAGVEVGPAPKDLHAELMRLGAFLLTQGTTEAPSA